MNYDLKELLNKFVNDVDVNNMYSHEKLKTALEWAYKKGYKEGWDEGHIEGFDNGYHNDQTK